MGFGVVEGGRRESVQKGEGLQTFPPNPVLVFSFSPIIVYSALKASNHLVYRVIISTDTLGLRASNMPLKSFMVNALGFASLSLAFPDSKNSPMSESCAD